jgi:hypothetical protein
MTHLNPRQNLNSRESQDLRYTKPMILVLPKHLEKRLEEFLAQQLQPQRRNSKGFIVPSFVGSVASEDSTWIDQHEEFLWNNDGRRTLCC